jgi:sodium-dependent phosphate cotransporter
MGTTVTAFIAAAINANTAGAISIAIAHFLFNLIGVSLFFPIQALRRLPMKLAGGLGKLTLKYRLVGFVYILVAFFFVPFTLIYFNQDSIVTLELSYQETNASGESRTYGMVSRMNTRTQIGEWTKFSAGSDQREPSLIFTVTLKNNTLFVGNQMYLFGRPGFCWDGEVANGEYESCIEKIVPSMTVAGGTFDSVYVFSVEYRSMADSSAHRYYFSAPYKILLKHETNSPMGRTIVHEELVQFRLN